MPHQPKALAVAIAVMAALAGAPLLPAHAQLAAPDRGALDIAQLVRLISLFVDEQETYEQLNTELLTRWSAVPQALIAGDTLVSAWGGPIRVAPFNAENSLARLHLSAVPQASCVELAFLLLDHSRVVGLYIDNQQLNIRPESFGEMMLALGQECPETPSAIDVIIR